MTFKNLGLILVRAASLAGRAAALLAAALITRAWSRLPERSRPAMTRLARLRETIRHSPASATLFVVSAAAPVVLALWLLVLLPAQRCGSADASGSRPPVSRARACVPAQPDARMLDLRTELQYLRARVRMARSDSIGLLVDLKDSCVSLQIQGLIARQCTIRRARVSRGLRLALANGSLLETATELQVRSELSTIPKAPVKVKEAPQDTTEAAPSADTTGVPEDLDVYFVLNFDDNIELRVGQQERSSVKGWGALLMQGAKQRLLFAGRNLLSLCTFDIPQCQKSIAVEIPREDAIAVYRALPEGARVAVRF